MEDLSALSDRSIQLLLRDIDQADFVVGALEMSRELRNRFLDNMSQRARDAVLKDWESMKRPTAEKASKVREKLLRAANQLPPE